MDYGTVEYYKELFSDILADVGCRDSVDENLVEGTKILAGFEAAINDWINYHETAALSFQKIKDAFSELGS